MRTILFTLKTKAITRYQDRTQDTNSEENVHIIWDDKYNSEGFILKIENTAGSWYLTTLLESSNNYLKDDESYIHIYGQEFTCRNIKALLEEVIATLKEKKIQIITE